MSKLRKYCLIVAFSFISMNVGAEGNEFGRLFTTPEERHRLDKLRAGKQSIINTKERIKGLGTVKGKPEGIVSIENNVSANSKDVGHKKNQNNLSLHLSGVIVRNDGQEEVWVNGKLLSSNNGLDAVISKKNTVLLKKGNQENSPSQAKLKVGQKWLPYSNKVIDVYSNKENE